MPLIKSGSPKAVSQNIRELHTGDTYARTKAKFGKQKADKQAVAIALSTARRARKKYQTGGNVEPDALRLEMARRISPNLEIRGGAYTSPLESSRLPKTFPKPQGPSGVYLGATRRFQDGGEVDPIIEPPSTDPAAPISRALLPNITGLLRREPNPREAIADIPSPEGKLPSRDDPRLAGAVGEAIGLGSAAALPVTALPRLAGPYAARVAVPAATGRLGPTGLIAGTGTGVLGSTLGDVASAQEGAIDPEPRRSPEHAAQVRELQRKITETQAKIDGLRARFPDKKDEDRLARNLRGPTTELTKYKGDLNSIDADYQSEYAAWKARRDAILERQRDFEELQRQQRQKAAVPFRTKYPEETHNIRLGAIAAAGGLGTAAGLAYPTIKGGTGRAILAGIPIGALGAYGPDLFDLQGESTSDAAWERMKTDRSIRTGSGGVLLDTGIAGTAAYGAHYLPRGLRALAAFPAAVGRSIRGGIEAFRRPAPTVLVDTRGRRIQRNPTGDGYVYGNNKEVPKSMLPEGMASGGRVRPWEGGGFAPYDEPPRRRREVPLPRPRPDDNPFRPPPFVIETAAFPEPPPRFVAEAAAHPGPIGEPEDRLGPEFSTSMREVRERPGIDVMEILAALPPGRALRMLANLRPRYQPVPRESEPRLVEPLARFAEPPPPLRVENMTPQPPIRYGRNTERDPETGRYTFPNPYKFEGMQRGGAIARLRQTPLDRLRSVENEIDYKYYFNKDSGATEDTYWHNRMNPRDDPDKYRRFREPELSRGGSAVQQIPWTQRASAQRLAFAGGMINSPVPGRTDKLNLDVPAGSYVIPSSVVSFLGQDNSQAGAGILNNMFGMGPGGTRMGRGFRSPRMRSGRRRFAVGGEVPEGTGQPTSIVAAGGEFLVPPQALVDTLGTDLKTAHKIMDEFVVQAQKKHVAELQKLKPPVGSKTG